jgi:hypothetical protein
MIMIMIMMIMMILDRPSVLVGPVRTTTVQTGGATEFRNRHKIVSFFLFDP